jgi:hypothetical protein
MRTESSYCGPQDKPPKDDLSTKIFGHIEVAPIFTLESGRPVNPLTGIDSNGNGAFPLSSRPLGFGRNSFKTTTLANMDFRVLKYFPFGETAKLEVVAEAFKLFNRANIAQNNPVFGLGTAVLPGFLRTFTALGGRRIQFSLDLSSRDTSSFLDGTHNAQHRVAVQILQREVNQMGYRIDRDGVRMRHLQRSLED